MTVQELCLVKIAQINHFVSFPEIIWCFSFWDALDSDLSFFCFYASTWNIILTCDSKMMTSAAVFWLQFSQNKSFSCRLYLFCATPFVEVLLSLPQETKTYYHQCEDRHCCSRYREWESTWNKQLWVVFESQTAGRKPCSKPTMIFIHVCVYWCEKGNIRDTLVCL